MFWLFSTKEVCSQMCCRERISQVLWERWKPSLKPAWVEIKGILACLWRMTSVHERSLGGGGDALELSILFRSVCRVTVLPCDCLNMCLLWGSAGSSKANQAFLWDLIVKWPIFLPGLSLCVTPDILVGLSCLCRQHLSKDVCRRLCSMPRGQVRSLPKRREPLYSGHILRSLEAAW